MEDKNELSEFLDKQICEKRIVIGQLTTEIGRLKIKADYDFQLENLRDKKAENKNKQDLVNKSDSLTSREYSLKKQEEALLRQRREIEKRENMMLDLEKQRMRLFEERRDFLNYQRDEQKKIDEGQEIVQQAKYKEDVIKEKEDSLFNLEERMIPKTEEFDRRGYEVEQAEKRLKIEKANFEAMRKGETNVTKST